MSSSKCPVKVSSCGSCACVGPSKILSELLEGIDQPEISPIPHARVSAPPVREDAPYTVPPCVYYGMERDEATKQDYVECYDRVREQWSR